MDNSLPMNLMIVDGYNLINKLPRLIKAKKNSIESARDELFNLIQAYCDSTEIDAIIVYDGKQKERSIEKGSPTVIFSSAGESADTVIESLAYKLNNKCNLKVVTDDRAQRDIVSGIGAGVLSSDMMKSELESASKSIRDFIEEKEAGLKGRLDL